MESTSPSSGRPSYHAPRPGAPSPRPGDESEACDETVAAALWCPHCKTPFVGRLSASDGTYVHPGCGGRSELDLALLDDLAADSWFWRRYRDRLRGDAPEGGSAKAD